MCEIGMRVFAPDGRRGIIIGHMGNQAIISIDSPDGSAAGETVLVPDGRARPITHQRRAVVVHPNGRAVPLSREDSRRVHVRPPK